MRELSIAFQTDKTPAQYIALAKLVDQYDFDAVSVYCDAPFHPSYGPLLLMAPHIQKARLGPAAVSPACIRTRTPTRGRSPVAVTRSRLTGGFLAAGYRRVIVVVIVPGSQRRSHKKDEGQGHPAKAAPAVKKLGTSAPPRRGSR